MISIIIIIIILIIQGLTIWYAFREDDQIPAILWGAVTLSLLIIFLFSYSDFINLEGQYKTVDAKITIVDQNSQALIEESKKVLYQYPELEKSLLKDLKPETMVALGQVYPNLKSNESYNKIATLLKERMVEKESLQKEKLDLKAKLYAHSKWWWFGSEYENI